MQQNATVAPNSPKLALEQRIAALQTEQIKLATQMKVNAKEKMAHELTLLTLEN